MACNCRKGGVSYVWTSEDGSQSKSFSNEVQAKAKKMRDGGNYITVAQS